MHVVLNAQLLTNAASYRGAGVSQYSRHLVEALGRCNGASGTFDALTALINDPTFQATGVNLIRTSTKMQQPLWRIAWEQTILPRRLHELRADLVHGLVNVLPLATAIPGVVTVHDLSFMRMPEKLPAAKRFYLAHSCRASVHKARQVIAVSRQTADDLMAFFGVAASKIIVVPNGVEARFQPADAAEIAAFRHRRGLPERFVLYLGTLEPRKNLPLLIRAYAAWRQAAGESTQQTKLVLAGAQGWFYDEIFAQVKALGLREQVLFPGFVPTAELPDWYRAAELFVYPSLYEGFGLPVLEAMACGTPVLCSQANSLMEIVADSAYTFPADDEAALRHGLHELLKQPTLRADLRQRGLARAQQFSWQRTAAETLDVYHKTIG